MLPEGHLYPSLRQADVGSNAMPSEWLVGLRSAPSFAGDPSFYGGGGGPMPFGEPITQPVPLRPRHHAARRSGATPTRNGIPDRSDPCPNEPGLPGREARLRAATGESDERCWPSEARRGTRRSRRRTAARSLLKLDGTSPGGRSEGSGRDRRRRLAARQRHPRGVELRVGGATRKVTGTLHAVSIEAASASPTATSPAASALSSRARRTPTTRRSPARSSRRASPPSRGSPSPSTTSPRPGRTASSIR